MEIRNLKKEDAGEVIDLWNRCLRHDKTHYPSYIDTYLLNQQKLDQITGNPNFDWKGAFVACDGPCIVGFGRSAIQKVASYEGQKLEDSPGYLEGLAVEPSIRRKGTGTRILQSIESYIIAEGKRAIRISCFRSPVAGIAVLPKTPEYCFLLKRGFRPEGFEISLKMDFEHFSLNDELTGARERLKKEQIEIRHYQAKDKESFSRLMKTQVDFQGWWHHTYEPNLRKEKPLPVLVAVDTRQDAVVGFVGFVNVDKNGMAAFTPGVHPDYRKRGIGKVLVNVWADEVKRMGAKESRISTGTENLAAQRIYRNAGYKNIGRFCRTMAKTFEST